MRASRKNNNQILLYETADGENRVEVLHESDTVWLSQAQMAELFQTDRSAIAKHISNIYSSGELSQEATCANFAQVRNEGDRTVERQILYYNLDVIIAVGYRVNSRRGTQFRMWATKTLGEFARKGFVMDDIRLANGGSRYFEELVERVRRIRTSEVNFYTKVREIFSTSIDYDNDSEAAHTFFATVQNKFHYAIHGHTAAELVLERVGRDKLNLGLSNWRKGVFTLQDAFIAKNYLNQTELKRLELLVEQFLVFAELRYFEKQIMKMQDWIKKLDQFIGELNEKPVLANAGVKSRDDMERKVREEYEAYKQRMLDEQALSDIEWNMLIQDAALNMLLPPLDELEVEADPEYIEMRLSQFGNNEGMLFDSDAQPPDRLENDPYIPTKQEQPIIVSVHSRPTTRRPTPPRKGKA